MTSPYREAPQLLVCPRCGEVLDRVFSGVAACPGCSGAWIAQATLDTAFGNPRWPPGQNMWWHATLECPECACEGSAVKMDARSANGVMVDLCPSHGLWLDQGELARLMGLDAGADELLELQKRVSAIAPDPDELAQRRLAWRTELDARRRAATEFRSWVEKENQRRAEAAAEAERQRKITEAEERRQRRQAKLAEAAAQQERAYQAAQQRSLRAELADQRATLLVRIRAIDTEMAGKREALVALQAELDSLKMTLHEIDRELEANTDKPK